MSSSRDQLLTRLSLLLREHSAATIMFHQNVADALGLRVTDHKCVDRLYRHGPMTAGEIAEVTGLTAGAVTGMIDRLEAAGLAERRHDPEDRRRVLVHLVPPPAFLRQIKAHFASMRQAITGLAEEFTDEELETIARFLERTTEVVNEETVKLRETTHPHARTHPHHI